LFLFKYLSVFIVLIINYFRGYVIIVMDEFTETSKEKWVPLLARSPADGKISGEIHVLVDINFAKV
jgi:hypothetical protein